MLSQTQDIVTIYEDSREDESSKSMLLTSTTPTQQTLAPPAKVVTKISATQILHQTSKKAESDFLQQVEAPQLRKIAEEAKFQQTTLSELADWRQEIRNLHEKLLAQVIREKQAQHDAIGKQMTELIRQLEEM